VNSVLRTYHNPIKYEPHATGTKSRLKSLTKLSLHSRIFRQELYKKGKEKQNKFAFVLICIYMTLKEFKKPAVQKAENGGKLAATRGMCKYFELISSSDCKRKKGGLKCAQRRVKSAKLIL